MSPPNKVSVVVPTHNRPQLVAEAVASICAQTRSPDELIVVDDAETRADDTLGEVAGCAGVPLRYVTRTGPTGASASRNVGAEMAVGGVLAFCDDDDRWAPDYLRRAIEAMGDGAVPLVVTWSRYFDGERAAPGTSIQPGLGFDDVLATNPGITGSNIVVRRREYLAIGGFDPDLPVSNDKDFFARWLDEGLAYGVVPEELVLRRMHDGERLGTSAGRQLALRRYEEKWSSRLTRADRRHLRAMAIQAKRADTTTTWARLRCTARFLAVAGPRRFQQMREESRRRDLTYTDP